MQLLIAKSMYVDGSSGTTKLARGARGEGMVIARIRMAPTNRILFTRAGVRVRQARYQVTRLYPLGSAWAIAEYMG